MTEATKQHGFSRRNFIKGAATLTAAGALVGCSPQGKNLEEAKKEAATAPEEQIFAGACRGNCGGGCFLDIHVRDGQVVRTKARDLPDAQYNRICPRGLTHVGRMYSSERILYPMKRIGERGEGKFERITWNEAIDTIAEKWKGYTEEFGNEAMSVFYGSGQYGLCSGIALSGTNERFRNVVGSSTITLNVDTAAGYGAQRATGNREWGGTNESKDRLNAKTIICWGSSPTISMIHQMHFNLEAKDKGAKYIVIDPVFNANAGKADWFIPIKAGTDGALAFGIMNVLFEEGWVDESLLRDKTNAPLLIKEDGMFVRMSDLGVEPKEGDVDPMTGKPKVINPLVVWDVAVGQAVQIAEAKNPLYENVPEFNGLKVTTAYENAREQISLYPLDKVEQITGIPEADVRELARVYHEEGPVSTEVMQGVNHYINAHYNTWPMWLVSVLTGNIGKPGACIGNEQCIPAHIMNTKVGDFPTDKSGNPCLKQGRKILINEVGNVFETGQYLGKDITLKGMYLTASNPITTMTDRNYTLGWFNKFEFIVVTDMCLTETARHADIILPAAHWFEQVDLFTSYAIHPYLLWQEKAVEPLGEAKSDFQIYKLLAEKLGYGEYWDISEEDFIEIMLDTDEARKIGCTFEKVKSEQAVKMFSDETYLANKDMVFKTETTRANMYQETVNPSYNIGQPIDESIEKKLYWEPPRYCAETSEARQTYPYHILSEHMRTRTHTQWWECGYVKEYEPEPLVRINPEDATELGIKEGDTVKLFNDRGFVVMKVAINSGLPRKMLSSARSFQANEFIEGHFASLPCKEFNQVVANQVFNDVVVDIEKM